MRHGFDAALRGGARGERLGSKVEVVHETAFGVREAERQVGFARALKLPLSQLSHHEPRQLHEPAASFGLCVAQFTRDCFELATDEDTIRLNVLSLQPQHLLHQFKLVARGSKMRSCC